MTHTLRRVLLALAASLSVAACSSHDMSSSALPAGANPASVSPLAHQLGANVRALCADPAPGFSRCFALVRTDVRYDRLPTYQAKLGVTPESLAAGQPNEFYFPLGAPQIQKAYNLPSAKGGKGQTIGLVDAYDDPTAESDLVQYRKAMKLPSCTTANGCFQKLNESGKTSPLPKPNADWSGEISLDLDMVSAVCPNCHIVLIEATTNSNKNLGASVQTAVTAGANVVSNSYGSPECFLVKGKVECAAPSNPSSYDIPGVIITASSGDSSWFAGPQSPADYGTVVSVGGTSIYPYANSRGYIESAWTSGGSSCSKYIKRPSWVSAAAKCPGNTRPIADVSAIADPYTGVLVYQTYPDTKGSFGVYGGTSAASPIIAAVYGLAGNAATIGNGKLLYNAPKGSLTDVVIGKNGIIGYLNDADQPCDPIYICSAGPGYDGPTGNGTPWGVAAF
jgi:subtilase family serine protease